MTTNLSELAQRHITVTAEKDDIESALFDSLAKFAESEVGGKVFWVGDLEWNEHTSLRLKFKSCNLNYSDEGFHEVGFSFFDNPDVYIDKANREKVANQEQAAAMVEFCRQEGEKRKLRELLAKYPDVKP